MPIYSFACNDDFVAPMTFDKTFRSFAEMERAMENKEIACPWCEQTEYITREVAQTAPPKFKGSGFHATDY